MAGSPAHHRHRAHAALLIDFVGESVTGMGSLLLAALMLFFIGAEVSAFASSVAVPGSAFAESGPFSINGAGPGPCAGPGQAPLPARCWPMARS